MLKEIGAASCRAGVSVGSVSATLNEAAPVSAEMRRKVMAAVEELGYTRTMSRAA